MPEISNPSSTPKSLVTGATGRIGGTPAELLSEAGNPYRVIACRDDQLQSFHDRGIEASGSDANAASSVPGAADYGRQTIVRATAGPHSRSFDPAAS